MKSTTPETLAPEAYTPYLLPPETVKALKDLEKQLVSFQFHVPFRYGSVDAIDEEGIFGIGRLHLTDKPEGTYAWISPEYSRNLSDKPLLIQPNNALQFSKPEDLPVRLRARFFGKYLDARDSLGLSPALLALEKEF